jgi:hypothetical protein
MTKTAFNQSILMPQNVAADDIPGLCFTVHLVSDLAELEHLVRPWERLAEMAVCPNPYFDPDFLIPALNHLAEQQVQVLIVTSYPLSDSNGIPVFCGLMPFIKKKMDVPGKKRYHRSVTGIEIWQHSQCHDCTPLIREEVAAETLECLINYVHDELGAQIIRTNDIQADSAFTELLDQALKNRLGLSHTMEQIATEPQKTIAHASSRSSDCQAETKIEAVSLRDKLSARGEIETTHLGNRTDAVWIDEFLRLEAANRTTPITNHIRCHASNSFFRDMATRMLTNGKMTLCKTTLSQQPIAMSCDISHRSHQSHRPSTSAAETRLRFKEAFVTSLREYVPALLPASLDREQTTQVLTFSTHKASVSKSAATPMINRLKKFTFRKTTTTS